MKTKTGQLIAVTGMLVTLLAGCGEAKRSPPAGGAATGTTNSNAAAEPGSSESARSESASADSPSASVEERPGGNKVTLAIKDFDGIQELIASKRGKVVVMDCWSTSCEPCVKEFPGLVALHQKYGADKVACISLSFDYEGARNEKPEDHMEDILEFLRGKDATFDNVIASVPADELYKPLGFKAAAVPAIFVYDQEGNIARQFESTEAKYAEVGKLVAELTEKAPEASGGGADE